jgi:CHAT domain-containing protein
MMSSNKIGFTATALLIHLCCLSPTIVSAQATATGQQGATTATPAPTLSPERAVVEARIKAIFDLLLSGDYFESLRLAEIGLADADRTSDLRLEERMIQIKAGALRRQSRPAEAETFLRERMATNKWKVGTNERAGISLSLAGSLLEQGRIQEGAAWLEAEKATFWADAVPDNTKSNYYGVLGAALVGLKQFEAAEVAMMSYAQIAERALGTNNPRVAEAWEAAGAAAEANKRESVAFDRYRRAVELATPVVPPGGIQVARHQMNYARMAIALKKPDLAREIAQNNLNAQYLAWRGGYGIAKNTTALEQRIFVTNTDVLLMAELQQNSDIEKRKDPVIVDRVLDAIQRASWAGRALASEEIAEILAQSTPALSDLLTQVRATKDVENGTTLLKQSQIGTQGLHANIANVASIQAGLATRDGVIALYDGVDETHIVLITKTKSEWRTLPITRNEMCGRIARVRASMSPNSPLICSDASAERFSVSTAPVGTSTTAITRPAYDRRAAFAIYNDTIGGFGASLRTIERLAILPLGSYGAVPWAALPTQEPVGSDDDQAAVSQTSWAVQKFEIMLVSSLVPSAQAPRLRNKTVLGFGSDEAQTRLTSPQAVEISTLVGLGGEANSKSFWGPNKVHEQFQAQEPRDVAAIVVSAHGLVTTSGARRDPGIILSLNSGETNQVLNSTDIIGSRLSARLVILAACDLAVTNGQPSGDAFGPLVSAFGARGAGVILAPIAPLTDANSLNFTKPILTSFLAGQGNVAASLRRSQLAWLRENRSSSLQHPSYWAVFATIVP